MSNKVKFISRRKKRELLEKLAAAEEGSEEAKSIREKLGAHAPAIELPPEPVVEVIPEPAPEPVKEIVKPKAKFKPKPKVIKKTIRKPKSKTRSISSKK